VRAGTTSIALAATRSILQSALEAADRLHGKGLELAAYSCPVLSVEPPATFAPLSRHQAVLAVVEHGAPGGFGSFLKELAPQGSRFGSALSQEFLRRQAALDGEALAKLTLHLA
jgi:transketolase C-terminal domain/subunit